MNRDGKLLRGLRIAAVPVVVISMLLLGGCAGSRSQRDPLPPPILGLPSPEQVKAAYGSITVRTTNGTVVAPLLEGDGAKGEAANLPLLLGLLATIDPGAIVDEPGDAANSKPQKVVYADFDRLALFADRHIAREITRLLILQETNAETTGAEPFDKRDLLHALDHRDIAIKRLGAHCIALFEVRDSDVVARLREYTDHEDALLRLIVAHATGRIVGEFPELLLETGLRDHRAEVRCYACYAIGTWEHRAAKMWRSVVELIEDKNPHVRAAAAVAVVRLAGHEADSARILNEFSSRPVNQELIGYPYLDRSIRRPVASFVADAPGESARRQEE